MTASFVHLHLHTQFSLLDGANQIEPLVRQIKQFGQPAVAITDHGNMFGAIDFYRKAKDIGVKPIIGCEAYMALGSRHAKKDSGLASFPLSRTVVPSDAVLGAPIEPWSISTLNPAGNVTRTELPDVESVANAQTGNVTRPLPTRTWRLTGLPGSTRLNVSWSDRASPP